LNGKPANSQLPASTRLSDVLRIEMGLPGTKIGCNAGDCGACSVLLDGAPICSCLTAIAQVEGAAVTSIEGLHADGTIAKLQDSFLAHGAAQCGICTPGMMVAASALLAENPAPNRQDVEDALGGVLCRCTGYSKIIDAVLAVGGDAKISPRPQAGQNVGSPIRHLDGQPKVDGSLIYGDDAVPQDALLVRVIRSPHHYSSFKIGDKAGFLASHPGILAVLDASDIPGRNCFGVIPPFADQPVFAETTALYRGDAVAAIVGDADVITHFDEGDFPITWIPHETMLAPASAMADGARKMHANRDGNILVRGYVETGDADQALAAAAHKIEIHTTTPFIEHAYIEPEAGYATREGNRLVIHGCTQAAQMDRESLAEIMGMELDAIRVVPSACGGGFGSKLDVSFQPYVALAAWVLGRSARICYSRSESMRASTKRHPS
jgi:aerobic-type carbon monoxide dehydrogenase small subunit (CoxS/CutS family)